MPNVTRTIREQKVRRREEDEEEKRRRKRKAVALCFKPFTARRWMGRGPPRSGSDHVGQEVGGPKVMLAGLSPFVGMIWKR